MKPLAMNCNWQSSLSGYPLYLRKRHTVNALPLTKDRVNIHGHPGVAAISAASPISASAA
ncbi:MAG: hypothetical protein AAB899_02670 [Patescibacteria group bacterium]